MICSLLILLILPRNTLLIVSNLHPLNLLIVQLNSTWCLGKASDIHFFPPQIALLASPQIWLCVVLLSSNITVKQLMSFIRRLLVFPCSSSRPFSFLFWGANINGEGSSIVSVSLIISFLKHHSGLRFGVVVTHGSLLYNHLLSIDFPKSYLIVIPSFLRVKIFSFLLKLFLPIGLFAERVLVLDDFPFLYCGRAKQFVFLQQALIFSISFFGASRLLIFKLLCFSSPFIILQTLHMKKLLLAELNIPQKKILHFYHYPEFLAWTFFTPLRCFLTRIIHCFFLCSLKFVLFSRI